MVTSNRAGPSFHLPGAAWGWPRGEWRLWGSCLGSRVLCSASASGILHCVGVEVTSSRSRALPHQVALHPPQDAGQAAGALLSCGCHQQSGRGHPCP